MPNGIGRADRCVEIISDAFDFLWTKCGDEDCRVCPLLKITKDTESCETAFARTLIGATGRTPIVERSTWRAKQWCRLCGAPIADASMAVCERCGAINCAPENGRLGGVKKPVEGGDAA